MAGSSFGNIFRLTSFGESHGVAIGGIVEGCPAGLMIDLDFVQHELNRRKPGQSALSSPRQEDDQVEFLSGIFEGKSTGTPIGFLIRNKDARSQDYSQIKEAYRPSHADYTYDQKYGFRDYRGGGRSSARETACRVVAGAIAKLFLSQHSISVQAFVKQVGKISTPHNFDGLDLTKIDSNLVRCPDPTTALQMIAAIEAARDSGDSLGGLIQAVIKNVPAGLGEPVFDKLHAVLAHAMMSINAVKGFEIGSGFAGVAELGSQQNDEFVPTESKTISTRQNNSGGIQGGISNGQPIWYNVAFKPVATIKKEQQTVNAAGEAKVLAASGRHDPCVLPRAVPIVESMAALVVADFLLLARTNRL